jgi:hypothetical protein
MASDDDCRTRLSLLALGFDEAAVARLLPEEANRLDATIERFVAYGYGQASQCRFMVTPHPRLEGRAPAETLGLIDGLKQVMSVIDGQLAALERSR